MFLRGNTFIYIYTRANIYPIFKVQTVAYIILNICHLLTRTLVLKRKIYYVNTMHCN